MIIIIIVVIILSYYDTCTSRTFIPLADRERGLVEAAGALMSFLVWFPARTVWSLLGRFNNLLAFRFDDTNRQTRPLQDRLKYSIVCL